MAMKGKMDGHSGKVFKMSKVPAMKGSAVYMRRKAENVLKARGGSIIREGEDPAKLIYELRVNEIELEMQQEELYRTQCELTESLERYQDLYDSSPAGYLTLEGKLRIIEANVTAAAMLKIEMGQLIGQPFIRFITDVSQAEFLQYFKKASVLRRPTTSGFECRCSDGSTFYALVTCRADSDMQGTDPRCRLTLVDITERQSARQELINSEARYRELFSHISSGVAVYKATGTGDDFIILDFNQAAENIERVDKDSILGKSVKKAFPGVHKMGILDAFRRVWQTGIPEHFPLTQYQDNRISGWRDNFIYKLPSGEVVAVYEDMTELKKIEELLKDRDERYTSLFERSPDLIYMHDFEGNIIDANEAALQALGYSREEITSLKFSSLLSDDQLPLAHKVSKEIVKGSDSSGYTEFKLKTKSGGLITVETTGSLIYKGGKPVCIQGVARDISKRRQTESKSLENYSSLARSLDGMARALAFTSEIRDPYTSGHQKRVAELSAAIAHDLGLDKDAVMGIKIAGLLHDIGKIAIPEEVLSKAAKLTANEIKIIRMHPQISCDLLRGIEFPWPIVSMIIQHHERLDGSGYPFGLDRERIGFEAKIIMVADVVEAMTYYRAYRAALGINAALKELTEKKDLLYDSKAVDACVNLFTEKGFKFEETAGIADSRTAQQ